MTEIAGRKDEEGFEEGDDKTEEEEQDEAFDIALSGSSKSRSSPLHAPGRVAVIDSGVGSGGRATMRGSARSGDGGARWCRGFTYRGGAQKGSTK